MVIFRRRHHEELDARVADAEARAETAEEEAEVSRQRHEEVRRDVIIPLKRAAEHNRFAELIRATLIDGHYNNGGTHA